MSLLTSKGFLVLWSVMLVTTFLTCVLPEDPDDPSNATMYTLIQTPDGSVHEHALVDTVGKRLLLGAGFKLPEYVDSVRLAISFDEDTIFDTMLLVDHESVVSFDTIWTEYVFFTPGVYFVTLYPQTSIRLDPVYFTLTLRPSKEPIENQAPELKVSGNSVVKPGETCVLVTTATDPDLLQKITLQITKKPENGEFRGDSFSWVTPDDFSGFDTVTFIAMDNGYPQKFDTAVVVITVTTTPHLPVIELSGRLNYHPLETCSLLVTTSDEDEEQSLTVSVSGNPEGSGLQGDSLFIWTIPEDAADDSFTVTFTVTDNGVPPLSTSLDATIGVSAGETPKPAEWSDDTLAYTMFDNATYSLQLLPKWSNNDDDTTVFSLLSGAPDGDTITNGTYQFTSTAVSETVTHHIAIEAMRADSTTDTLHIELTIDSSPIEDLTLASVTLSAGNHNEFPAPLSDTIADTVTFEDSVITITPVASDTRTTLTIEEVAIASGEASAPLLLPAGTTTLTIKVADPSQELSKSYFVLVTRKQESTALSRLSLSAGTLTEQSAPVPDTIRDTVSYFDSTITLTPAVWETSSSITVNNESVLSGESSPSIALSEGDNEIPIKVTASDTSKQRTYTLIVVRKVNSTIELSTPPDGLSAEAFSASSIKITWNDLFGANQYTIERSESAEEDFTSLGTSTGNSYNDTGLSSGTTWYYRVKASNANNSSNFSEVVHSTSWRVPSVTSEPEDQMKTEGTTAEFSIAAVGIPAPTYQWQKNGINIDDATGATHTTPTLTLDDNGAEYRCMLSNSAGVDSSSVAVLSVDTLIIAPEITSQPGDTTLTAGTPAVFTIAATGTNIQYIWYLNDTLLQTSQEAHTISSAGIVNAGVYSVMVKNRADSIAGSPFTLKVLPKKPAGLAALIKSATSTELSWNTTNGALWYNLLRSKDGTAFASICTTSLTKYNDDGLEENGTYHYRLLACNHDGISDTTDAESATTWKKPEITTPPTGVTVTCGEPVTLSIEATGVPACEFQWRKNGGNLDGKTGSTLEIASSTTDHAGSYTVKVWNSADSVISTAAVVKIVPLMPTGLDAQILTATSARISWNSASGAEWYRLSRATSESGTYTVIVDSTTSTSYSNTGLSESQSYFYKVQAGNSDGTSDMTDAVPLSTPTTPSISTHPSDKSLIQGNNLSLSVTASGSGTLEYLWYKDDEPTTVTTRTFGKTGVNVTDAGEYYVEVTNAYGSINSNVATVTVTPVHTLSTNVLPADGGSVTVSPSGTTFPKGTKVTLTANAATGFQFSHWTGSGVSGNNSSVEITVNGDMAVTANFVRMYSLTTNVSISGAGTITRSPSAGSYAEGTEVTLTANTNSGYRFTGWSGDVSGTGATVNILIDQNRSVTANFVRQYTLTVVASDPNKGSVSPASVTVDAGGYVNISAIPDAQHTFSNWVAITSGSNISIENPTYEDTRVIVNGNATVEAQFQCYTFIERFDNPMYAYNVGQGNDNTYFVSGYDFHDSYVLQLDQNGNITKTNLITSVQGPIQLMSMRKSPAGYFWLASNNTLSSSTDIRVQKMNVSGGILTPTSLGQGGVYFAEPTTDGGALVVGDTSGRGTFMAKIDQYGTVVWKSFHSCGEQIRDGIQTSDGGYIIIGVSSSCENTILKLNSSGNKSWETTLTGFLAESVCERENGDLFVGGDNKTPALCGDWQHGTAAIRILNSNGNEADEIINSDGYNITGIRKLSGNEGFIYVCSTDLIGPSTIGNVLIVKTDGNGNTVWQKVYGTEDYGFWGESIELTTDGGFIAIGRSSKAYVIKTNENGNVGN